jgi:outer membrane protein TolC
MRSRELTLAALALGSGCYTPPSAAPLTPAEVEAWSAGRATARAPGPSAAPASWDFDVEAAVAYARDHGPMANERKHVEAVSRAEIDAEGQLTNPEVRFGRTFDGTVGQSDRLVVALRVRPDQPWERHGKVASARAELAAEQALSKVLHRDAVLEIRKHYATLAFGEATRDVITKQLALLVERQRVIDAQVARGAATQLEALLAGEDLLDLEATRATLDVELTTARKELSDLVGIPPGQTWRPVWDLAKLREVTTTFDRAAIANRALAARPELAEADHRIRAADALAYAERAKRYPWFDYFQVERSVKDAVDWAVSVSVTLPVFSLNGGEVAAADARTHAAAAGKRRIATHTLSEVDDAIALAEITGKRARDLAARLEPLQKALTELLADPGSSLAMDPVKLLLLQGRHVRAERAVLEAAYEHRLALIQLEVLTGDSSWR